MQEKFVTHHAGGEEVITNFSLNSLPNILCQLLYIAFIK